MPWDKIDGLKDALARLRKFGGRCVLGFQSVAQVSSTYGQADAHTIVENCGNTLILRCSASEGGGTARFASQLIGEREVMRRRFRDSRRVTELLGSVSRSRSILARAGGARVTSRAAARPARLPEVCVGSAIGVRVRLDATQAWRDARATASAALSVHRPRSQRSMGAEHD